MFIGKCLYILRNTNDGDDLAPHHLKLVEMAANGRLNDRGKNALNELYEKVKTGYVKPWLHGVQHLTKDHRGYVYWKGEHVEHYSFRHFNQEKAAAEELGRRCRKLEELGEKVDAANVVWYWDEKFANA